MKITPENRQQVLIIATIVMVGLFFADSFVIKPLTASWNDRSKSITELRKSVAQGKGVISRETQTRRVWNDMRKNTLPLDASRAEQQLLAAFDRWSQDARISVTSIKPQWKRGTSDEFSLLECRVDASGSLSALTRFLYEVERSPMALKIENIELAARDNTGQQLALGLLVSGLRLSPQEAR